MNKELNIVRWIGSSGGYEVLVWGEGEDEEKNVLLLSYSRPLTLSIHGRIERSFYFQLS
jgi:hypothetical protein